MPIELSYNAFAWLMESCVCVLIQLKVLGRLLVWMEKSDPALNVYPLVVYGYG